MGQLKSETESLQESIEQTLEINEDVIQFYENRIESQNFKSKNEEIIFRNGYMGFLIWATEQEYPEYDDQYKEKITTEE
jgi:hypothetical protein